MEVFKTFGTKLELFATRAFVEGISYEEATLAAQQIEWNQFHLIKNGDGTVSASFILGQGVGGELWAFIFGDDPGPQLA